MCIWALEHAYLFNKCSLLNNTVDINMDLVTCRRLNNMHVVFFLNNGLFLRRCTFMTDLPQDKANAT